MKHVAAILLLCFLVLCAFPIEGPHTDHRAAASGEESGKIAFVSDRDGNNEIYVMNLDGSDPQRLTENEAEDTRPVWSPDGQRIAFQSQRDDNWEIYVMDADGSNVERLTDDPGEDTDPDWVVGAESEQVLFSTTRDGHAALYRMNTDGTDPKLVSDTYYMDDISPSGHAVLFVSPENQAEGSVTLQYLNQGVTSTLFLYCMISEPIWSPKGQVVAANVKAEEEMGIYIFEPEAETALFTLRDLTPETTMDMMPAWSPDGEQIVFQSERDGNWEIYIMNADGSDPLRLTENDAQDTYPAWQPALPTSASGE